LVHLGGDQGRVWVVEAVEASRQVVEATGEDVHDEHMTLLKWLCKGQLLEL